MVTWCMLPEIWSVTDNLLSFWAIFSPVTDILTSKIKICEKKTPKNWRYPFTDVYHKWRSYDVWSLSKRQNRQSFLSFWAIFWSLTLLITRKIKILKKRKKTWGYYHFTLVYYELQSYDIWFLRYEAQQNVFHFGSFFVPFIQLTTSQKKIFKK